MAEVAAKIYFELDTGDDGLKVVCLKGEVGTGKTSLALFIHQLSSRGRKNLVRASAGSVVETLAESQLFGIRGGIVPGVNRDRPGWFYVADKGVLFVDDIGHLPLSVQKDFLTVLSEGIYTWIGDTEFSRTNAHVIVAANQSLDDLVSTRQFLPDLKSRIEVFEITVPPLRERKEDIRLLVKNHLALLCNKNPTCTIGDLSQDLMDAFLAYDWPSNIRELMAVVEGGVIMAMADPGATVLDWPHVQPHFRDRLLAPKARILRVGCDTSLTCDENVDALEREYLAQLLGECDGKFEEVKKRSGKARDTIKKMESRLREHLTHAPPEEVNRFRALAGKGWWRINPESKP